MVDVVDTGRITAGVEGEDGGSFSQSPVPTLSITITWAVIIDGKKHRAKLFKSNSFMIVDARLYGLDHRSTNTIRK